MFVPIRSAVGISRQSPFGRVLSPCDTDIEFENTSYLFLILPEHLALLESFDAQAISTSVSRISAGIAASHSQIAYASIKEMAIYFMQPSGL